MDEKSLDRLTVCTARVLGYRVENGHYLVTPQGHTLTLPDPAAIKLELKHFCKTLRNDIKHRYGIDIRTNARLKHAR